MQDNKETMATFHCVTRIEITRFKRTPGCILDYVLEIRTEDS